MISRRAFRDRRWVHHSSLLRDQAGSAAAEFVLVGMLLTLVTLGVLQLGLAVYVRNVVHDAAVEGAFHAALADTSVDSGVQRTRAIISRAIGAEFAQDVSARERAGAVEVTVRTTLPLVGLLGAPQAWEVTARAPKESLE